MFFIFTNLATSSKGIKDLPVLITSSIIVTRHPLIAYASLRSKHNLCLACLVIECTFNTYYNQKRTLIKYFIFSI